ncbi:MAG: SAM-dependent methyltransferase [Oscillatoriales cyanobacterium SM2_1_8]|nr:SAM-dependent methyltransferase [Oscillatoriales cyanobacterium SM2_1_8]
MTKELRPIAPLGLLVQRLEKLAPQMPAELQGELQGALALAAGLEPYLRACAAPESVILRDLVAAAIAEDWEGRFGDGTTTRRLEREMLSGHVEGQTLQLLVRLMGARRVLEVGTFVGYSALAMAEGLPETGEVITCEVDPYTADFARRHLDRSPHGGKVQIVVGPALATLDRLVAEGQTFDLIFLDADKKEYIEYSRRALDGNLLVRGGLLCADNTLYQGEAYLPDPSANGAAIAEFNRAIAADPRLHTVLLPLRDGLTLAYRR